MIWFQECAPHGFSPTGGSLRVFKFSGLRLDAVKAALSRSNDQRVSQAVSPLDSRIVIKQRVAV